MKLVSGSLALVGTALLVFIIGNVYSQSAFPVTGEGTLKQPNVVITQSAMAQAKVPQNVRVSLANGRLPVQARQALERYAGKLIQVENQRALNTASDIFLPDTAFLDSMGTDNNWHETFAEVFTYNNLGLTTLTVNTRRNFTQNIRKDIQEYTPEGLYNYQKGYFWNDTTSTWKDSYLDSVFYDSHGNMLRNSIYFSGSSGWLRTYQLDYNNTYTPEGWLKKSDVVYTDFDNSDYSSFNFTEVLAFGPNGEPLLSKYVQGLVNSGSPDSTENRVYSFHNFSPGAAEQTDSVVTLNYADGAWVPVLSWATTYREYDSYKTRHYVIVNNAAIPVYTEDQQFSGTGFGIGYEVDSVMTDGSVKLIWKRVGNLVVKPNGFVTQATFVEVNGTNPTDSIYVARYRYFGEHSVTGNAIKQNAKMGAFPNPFQNYLQLRFPSGILADAYTVSDFSGRILMHGQLHVNNGIAQISASDLNVGVYLLGLISKGQLLQTIKICKTPQ